MPQMMPLSWLTLYMLFIITMLMFSITNYFLYINKPKNYKKNMITKKINWKW
nr:ATP synthase F0 subunit 8 [Perisphaerus sp. 2 ZQW-2023b]